MWNLIETNGPPDRHRRTCCKLLKEAGVKHRFLIMGVRWTESTKRSQRKTYELIHVPKQDRLSFTNMDNDQDRQTFESCPIKGERTVNPIIDWTDEDIWDYIQANGIETNPLYKEYNFKRVGCIGCPLANTKHRELNFELFPIYKDNYIRAFNKNIKYREQRCQACPWKTGEQVFDWWMYGGKG